MELNTQNTGDYLLAAMFFVTGAYAYWEAESFPSSVALWPQMLGGFIVIGAGLLLIRNYLPTPLREYVSKSTEVIDVGKEFDETVQQEDFSEDEQVADTTEKVNSVDRPLDDTTFAALSISGYILVAYLVGLLWASPLFVVGYSLWFKQRPIVIIVLAVLSFAIAYGFMDLMYLPLDEGVLFGGL